MTLQDFARSESVSLTTFRKNGTPVATPVWAAAEGDVLYVWTRSDSWKVKRLPQQQQVVVTVCDVRGRIAEGAPSAEGEARLLDENGTRAARGLLGPQVHLEVLARRLARHHRPARQAAAHRDRHHVLNLLGPLSRGRAPGGRAPHRSAPESCA
ncbi:hypothetical protein SBADM41S_08347 [Streptomyces badius]